MCNDILIEDNMIYDSMCILQNGKEIWLYNLDLVKQYIDLNNKRPNDKDKNKDIKKLGMWVSTQNRNYKTKTQIMSNKLIYDTWHQFITSDQYKIYFISNEDSWLYNLDLVKQYIDLNNKRPNTHDKNKDIKKLGKWLSHQNNKYKTKTQIMLNKLIYDTWHQFITSDQYKIYFISNEDSWLYNLDLVKQYIDLNNKRPNTHDKNKDIKKLGKWLSHQNNKYKTKTQIMLNKLIYDTWHQFITSDKYKEYFK